MFLWRHEDDMDPAVLAPDLVRGALLDLNKWHPNVPLILVFSKQKKDPGDVVDGGNQAVRSTYDSLFSLDRVGIADDARKYYLHFCHQESAPERPHALRKPTDNYGKTHQRIIKDTFGQQFLDRRASGKYALRNDFPKLALGYFGAKDKIDLRPMVLYRYWNDIGQAKTVEDLWKRFCDEFGADRPPYDQIFTCSGVKDALRVVPAADFTFARMKQFVLPDEYGVGSFTEEFWKSFRQRLEQKLKGLKWQGDTYELSSNIAAALMYDQSVFLLGDPGTGKTTIVLEAILPALRETVGTNNEVRFSYHTLTPSTTSADLFGFQGLDGGWIEGPLVKELLVPYDPSSLPSRVTGGDNADADEEEATPGPDVEESEEESETTELSVPRLLFLDEANRISVEGLLAPLQAAFDRLQKRMEPPTVMLGGTEYAVPRRIWRIYAGNSPVADTERREQSRPFKRRCAMIVPPDPMEVILKREDSFRKLGLEILERAASSDDPELSEPALSLHGQYRENPGRLEQFRQLMLAVLNLKRVPVTVGLTESILLRSASQATLRPEGSLDWSACSSLGSQLAGERAELEKLAVVADNQSFPQLAKMIRRMLEQQGQMSMELDPIL